MSIAGERPTGVRGWMMLGGAGLVVMGILIESAANHGSLRYMLLGFTLAGVGVVMGLLGVALFRAYLLRDTYVMGYRHGRRDANLQLFEDGLWLAEKAEDRANGTAEEP